MVLGTVGGLVAYAVPMFVAKASEPAVGIQQGATSPAPLAASRCWTNHTSATVFLAPWFAPLAPTEGLRSDCSTRAVEPPPADVVAASSPAHKRLSSSAPLTTSATPGSPSQSEPRSPEPRTAERGRAAQNGDVGASQGPTNATDGQHEHSDGVGQTGDGAPGAEPKPPKPDHRQDDHGNRDRGMPSPPAGGGVEPDVVDNPGAHDTGAIGLGDLLSLVRRAVGLVDQGGNGADGRVGDSWMRLVR
jgi:hypothetical protein